MLIQEVNELQRAGLTTSNVIDALEFHIIENNQGLGNIAIYNQARKAVAELTRLEEIILGAIEAIRATDDYQMEILEEDWAAEQFANGVELSSEGWDCVDGVCNMRNFGEFDAQFEDEVEVA